MTTEEQVQEKGAAHESAPTQEQVDKYPDLRIDPELMEKIDDIVARLNNINELKRNVKVSEGGVKGNVYQKVLADYEQRLKAVTSEYEPVSQDMVDALKAIRKRENEIRRRMEDVNDEIEEKRFRHEVGEFSKEEIEPFEKEKQEILDKLNEQLKVVKSTYDLSKKYIINSEFEQAMTDGDAKDIKKSNINVKVTSSTVGNEGAQDGTADALKAVDEEEAGDIDDESRTVIRPITFPQDSSAPVLKVVDKNGKEESYPMTGESMVIGRSTRCDVVLRATDISRNHAKISKTANGYEIADVSSGGGFLLNGEKKRKSPLEPGDKISISTFDIQFEQ